jgi:hypothetical protein
MSSCREFEEAIDRLAAGGGDSEPGLAAHLETCSSCREGLHLLQGLQGSLRFAEPAAEDFAAMRQGVLLRLAGETAGNKRWRGFAGLGFWRPAWVVLAASALFVAGLITGTLRPRSPDAAAPLAATAELEALAGQMRRVALDSGIFDGDATSPYQVANVHVEAAPAGQLRLRFDVARHLDLTLAKDDPLVAEVLVQSLLGPSTVGSRLHAIDQAAGLLDPRIKEALVLAMRHDSNLGVQMQAQARLAAAPRDPAIVEAMLDVLANEEAVQMRLVAIDYLAASEVPGGRLERALDTGSATVNSAVLARADQYVLVNR